MKQLLTIVFQATPTTPVPMPQGAGLDVGGMVSAAVGLLAAIVAILVGVSQLIDFRQRQEKQKRARRGGASSPGEAQPPLSRATTLGGGQQGPIVLAPPPGAGVARPATGSSARRPAHNLPAQPTPFIGREAEIEALKELIQRDEVRLLTLVGPGGVGKTRLALRVAAELVERFADGVYLVDLGPVSDPSLVAAEIARTLGVQESRSQPLIDGLKSFLSTRRICLLLDNYEHLLGAAGLVGELVQAAAGLKVVVTSRVPLRVRGEREHTVLPLELPDPGRLPPLEELAGYEAVRLFIERATDVKAGFALDEENAPAVVEICVRLDGLPLAIELAAVRIKILPPQAIAARLRKSSLQILTGGSRDAPARQLTLRNTIEWSYELLSAGEKALLRRLAVFKGGSPSGRQARCAVEPERWAWKCWTACNRWPAAAC